MPSSPVTVRPGERAVAALMAFGLAALILWLLFGLGVVRLPERDRGGRPSVFTMGEEREASSTRAPTRRAERRTAKAASAPPRPRPAVPPPPSVPAPVPAPAAPWPYLKLTRDQFAATDIGAIRSRAEPGETAAGASAAGDSAAAYGPGAGPGGARLYNAEWYREPSDAELAGYLPAAGAPPGSWATIACRTVERYRVEDCRALDESPVGSGLGRAMRQAAWQFLVRPPRIGGKPIPGAWVRIRITFGAAKE